MKWDNCLEQSSYCDINGSSSSQEISQVIPNLKIYCRVQKSPPMIHIQNQMNSVHFLPPLQYYSYIYAYDFQEVYAFSLWKKYFFKTFLLSSVLAREEK
jgi:hypothetical protein